MEGINIPAVFVAALTSFLLGGLWYSPILLGKAWLREMGGQPQVGHPAKVFGLSFVFSLVAAAAFAHTLGPKPPLEKTVHCALIFGVGFVSMCFGINYQFSNRSIRLLLIDGGYHVAQFLLFAVVLGLWH